MPGLLGDSGAAACPRPMGGSSPVAGAAGLLPRSRSQGGTGPQRSRRRAEPRRQRVGDLSRIEVLGQQRAAQGEQQVQQLRVPLTARVRPGMAPEFLVNSGAISQYLSTMLMTFSHQI